MARRVPPPMSRASRAKVLRLYPETPDSFLDGSRSVAAVLDCMRLRRLAFPDTKPKKEKRHVRR